MKRVICLNCMNEVEYHTHDIEMAGKIRNKEYKYIGRVALCNDCCKEVDAPDVYDYNMEKLMEAFCVGNGLITKREIIAILDKYKIGKETLSKLLGWGTVTIKRLCSGSTPSRQYSEILKGLNDAREFEILLIKNKVNISESKYEKLKENLEDILYGRTVRMSCREVENNKIYFCPITVTTCTNTLCLSA